MLDPVVLAIVPAFALALWAGSEWMKTAHPLAYAALAVPRPGGRHRAGTVRQPYQPRPADTRPRLAPLYADVIADLAPASKRLPMPVPAPSWRTDDTAVFRPPVDADWRDETGVLYRDGAPLLIAGHDDRPPSEQEIAARMAAAYAPTVLVPVQ